MQKIIWLLIGLLLFIKPCFAQFSSYKTSKVIINSFNTFQIWDIREEKNIFQLGNQLMLKFNPGRSTSVSMNSWHIYSEVQSEKLQGISDVQFQLSQKIKSLNTVIDAGINIPSGKESLSPTELFSTILLSKDIFNFRKPLLGMGTNIFAGITWAAEVMNNFVIGLGFSYQRRGEYKPLKDQELIYKPSDEILASFGIDLKLDNSKTISADVLSVFYEDDKVDGEVVFSAGNKFIYGFRYIQFFKRNILLFDARYRSSSDDQIKNLLAVTNEKFTSDYLMIAASFYHSVSNSVSIKYIFEFRNFEETLRQFSGFSSYSPGLVFFFELSKHFEIPLHLKYLIGVNGTETLNGFDSGIGFNLKF